MPPRRFVAILFTLAASCGATRAQGQLLMEIPRLARGDVTLPGYEGWYTLNSFSVQIERNAPITMEVTRTSGPGSTDLFLHALSGNLIDDATIVDLRPSAKGLTAMLAWQLEDALIQSYESSGATGFGSELIKLTFSKIAFATRTPGGKIETIGWELARSDEWTTHGLAKKIETLPVSVTPGDFNGDGMVDSGDYNVWQDGLGDFTTGSDLLNWQANHGTKLQSVMSVPVPEPNALPCLAIAAITGGSLRRSAPCKPGPLCPP